MKRLAELAHGRDNNYHLLRVLAAAAVLLSHSFPLATGDKSSEPLRAQFGCTPGSIAVDLFFLISGLLVTISLVRRNSAADFMRARFFRIWPGLAVALLLSILVLGPAFTSLSTGAYFASIKTWRYFLQNLFLLKGIDYTLPGVFKANAWPEAVNGSLWTLPHEVKCYAYLLATWFLLHRLKRPDFFKVVVSIIWLVLLGWHFYALTQGSLEDSPVRLYFMFCSGAMLYLHRSAIVLSGWALIGGAIVVALCAGHGMTFGLAYSLVLPYAMVCFAYLPRGKILAYNRLGDYSYGTYIYAYPVQQSLMAMRPHLGPIPLFGSSLAITLAIAVLSWHLIEKPATKLARRKTPLPR
jgi:peptidoglycan/LPS O-acetylase OafA/YrhL